MIRERLPSKRDAVAAISGVDQRVRYCLRDLWLALPKDRRNWDELETTFRRLVDRAFRDFREDMDLFPPDDKPASRPWPHNPPE